MKIFWRLFPAFILFFSWIVGTACAAEAKCNQELQTGRPNIVFLLADDLGDGDLHCYGHPYARTPCIDSLAHDGTRFLQFHATGSVCCPARTGLMSAKLPASFPIYPAGGGLQNRVTITELLKKQGYATGHFGKWHLGPVQTPGTYGIDCIGATNGETDGQGLKADPRGRDAHIYDEAIKFIEDHKDGPFYVNVWGHVPHSPVNPVDVLVKRWTGLKVKDGDFSPQMVLKFDEARKAGGNVDDGMQRYLADVESLDSSVGRLLKKIDELGLRENTIVVFSSDQGADMSKVSRGGLRFNQMGYNGFQRGGKHTHWQGGVCVPWIVRWPDHTPAGRTDSKSIISGADWLPTLCAITGVSVNADDFDGEDTSDAWLGGTHTRSKPLFWKASNPDTDSFIRVGKWKLHLPPPKAVAEAELYDLDADPVESTNVASAHPEVVKDLTTKLKAWIATLPKEYITTNDKQD